MNTYTTIVVIGFLFKLAAGVFAIKRTKHHPDIELRISLVLAVLTVLLFSIPLFFVLADGELAQPFGLPRYVILRSYFFSSVLCSVPSLYLIIKVFFSRVLDNRRVASGLQLLGITVILVSIRFQLLGNEFVDESLLTKQKLAVELGQNVDSFLLVLGQSFVAAIFICMFLHFFYSYRKADNHQSQIVSFYALIALGLSALELCASIFINHPLLFSVRSVFFTIVLFLAIGGGIVFDARSQGVLTLEAKASRELQRVFRRYVNHERLHKEAMAELEAVLVQYKLDKEPQFCDADGSPLPELAKDMGLGLSTLYDIINRLNIRKPTK